MQITVILYNKKVQIFKMVMLNTKKNKKPAFQRTLDGIERVGNKLPHPATLFAIFALITMAISHIAYLAGVFVTYQGVDMATGEITDANVQVISLLTREGIAYLFTSAVTNFVGFAPLGTVLVAMLGVGVAEHVGLLSALIKKSMLGSSKRVITFMVIFVGLISNLASEIGYLVVIPLGAAIFYAVGRHPLAGLAAAFFGVSAGYAANMVVTINDILLSSISQEAARLVDPTAVVSPTSNLYFMFVSTLILASLGYVITEKIIIPKLGAYKPEGDVADVNISAELTADEKRGLRFSGWFLLAAVAFLLVLLIPPSAPLRNAETGSLLTGSPFMAGLVPVIMLVFLVPAIGYGIGTKSIRKDKDVIASMSKSMQTMGAYMVLAFFAAQFIAYFNYSKLGVILSVNGALFLQNVGFTGIPLILTFILLSAFLNLFMGSSSAKWVIMAPIFIPMFMQLGYDPAFTQVAYRVGESVTNIITPLMSYFALIVVFAEKYVKKTGIGTIISLMLPYTIFALLVWSLLLVIWYLTGLPIGLGGGIYL